jgi:hypothetical protein
MELKITKEKILEAAEKCSTAKQTLKILFPEAFTEEVSIMFHKGDVLVSKKNNKQYLIAIDSDKNIRIVGLHSSYIWQDKKVKSADLFIRAFELKMVFADRNISDYDLRRGGKMYNVCTGQEI